MGSVRGCSLKFALGRGRAELVVGMMVSWEVVDGRWEGESEFGGGVSGGGEATPCRHGGD